MNTAAEAPSSGDVPPPPPPPTPPGSRPPLRRRREDRILGGVAGGIADHLGVDVALVRIVLVVLGLLNGLGVLLYVIAWIAVPEAEAGDHVAAASRPETRGGRDALFWAGVGLLVVGSIALVTGPLGLLPGTSAPQLVVPLVLIGFGLALWRAGEPERATPSDAEPPSTPPGAHHVVAPGPDGTAGDGPGPRARPDAGPGSADVEPSPSWVTQATLGLALLAVGVSWLLALTDVVSIGVGATLSMALLIIGLGLLVGSVVGRARWLLLAGGLLLPVVLVAQLTAPGLAALAGAWDPGSDGRAAGQFRLAPADLGELEPVYRLGAGSLELDLTAVEFDDETATVLVEVGAGQAQVTVPEDVELLVVGQAGIGQVELVGERSSAGLGAGPIRASRSPDDPRGSLELHLSAGVGQIEVTTAPATP